MERVSEWATSPPAPRLSPYVEQYMGYRYVGFEPGVHRGLPSRHPTFIVSIGPTIDVAEQTDSTQGPARFRAVLSGLQASSAVITHTGVQEGVTIMPTPLGFRSLFAMPISALWDTSVELADVAGSVGDELWERMQSTTTWPERFALCDEVLGRLSSAAEMAPELDETWARLVASGGTATIQDLARHVGWSRQHLARRFHEEFGLGPKLAARVVRFERARRMLGSTPSFVSLAQVAATCGYYDQSHLNRDFAELAGCTPTAWLAEELPSFQDDAASVV